MTAVPVPAVHPVFATPRHVAVVITRLAEFGGAQLHARDLAAEMQRNGWHPVIVTGALGPVSESAVAMGLEVVHLPELRREISVLQDVLATRALTRLFRARGIDLVCAHSSKAGILARVAARLAGCRAIFTAHGWAFTDGIPERTAALYRVIERAVGRFSDHVICVSENDRHIGLAARVLPPERMTTVHNGIFDMPAVLRAPRPHGATLRLIQISRFNPQKNHALLLHALSGLTSRNWHLSLAGGGDDGPIRELAAKLGLSDRISFLGERADVPDLLAQSDVACLATNWEGFPLVCLEAMRAGLPLVVNDVGGTAEAIVEGETGFAVPRDDVEAFRARLAYLMDHPSELARMGEAARRRFESEFRFDRMAKRTFDIYAAVLSRA